MNLSPEIWGPALWSTLHIMTFNYPQNPTDYEKQQYYQFFQALQYVLPCDSCRKHYGKGINETYPIQPALKNRDTLTRWLVMFHNVVNQRLGKPTVSYESVKQKYEALAGKCTSGCDLTEPSSSCTSSQVSQRKTNTLLYILISLLVIVVILSIYSLIVTTKHKHNN